MNKDEKEGGQLPEGWVARVNEEGQTFYLHKLTKKIVWNLSEIQKRDNAAPGAGGNQVESKVDEKNLTMEQTQRIFYNFFREKGVGLDTKWEKVNEMVLAEERLKNVGRIKDIKAIFKSFVESEKQMMKKNLQSKKEQAKKDFKKMLEEYKNISKDTKFQSLLPLFYQDNRWKAMEEKERDEAFQEYMQELFIRENQNEKIAIQNRCDSLKQKMLEMKKVTSMTTWEEIRDLMFYNPHWKDFHEYYRFKTYREFIQELREIEESEEKKLTDEAESCQRVDFIKLLVRLIREDKLTFQTSYAEVFEKVKDEEAYFSLLGQRVGPRNLFEKFSEKLNEQHSRIKSMFKALWKANIDTFKPNMSFDSFVVCLKGFREFSNFEERFPVSNSFAYFSLYLFNKMRKRQQKSIAKVFKFMYKMNVSLSDSFESVLPKMQGSKDSKYFELLPAAEVRKTFEEFQSLLREPEKLRKKLEGFSKKKLNISENLLRDKQYSKENQALDSRDSSVKEKASHNYRKDPPSRRHRNDHNSSASSDRGYDRRSKPPRKKRPYGKRDLSVSEEASRDEYEPGEVVVSGKAKKHLKRL